MTWTLFLRSHHSHTAYSSHISDTQRIGFRRCKSAVTTQQPRRARCKVQCETSQEEKSSGQQNAGPRPSFGDPVQTISWGGRLPSRRRVLSSTASATAIALVSNLGGSTSFLLGLFPSSFARTFRLDTLYPRKGYKRCFDPQNGFEFDYPAKWLADQRLLRRYASRIEQQTGLDPPPVQRAKQRQVSEPAAAYGPAGGSGEQNLSVIVAPIRPDFELASLGNPEQAAQRFLDDTIAPRSSEIVAKLIAASGRQIAGETYYTLEYTVQRPTFFRHNLSVYAVRNGLLYTLNAQSPVDRWEQAREQLRHAADSFRVLDAEGGLLGYPQQLR